MRARERTPTRDGLLERADRQLGLLRYDDLRAAGLGRSAIGRRVAAGRLTRIHHCVYAFGHTCLTDEARWLAALWACDSSAALSHLSAAAYHRWLPVDPTAPIHVSTTKSLRSRPGIIVHRVRRLERIDCFHAHPLTVTTVPRTLLDLADLLPWPAYRGIADRAGGLRLDKLADARERAPGRRGAPLVRRLLEADDAHTRSEFERRYLAFARAHGLPRPDGVNVRVAGHLVDCLYEDAKLALELDGRAYHERRDQMRADRRRDSDLQIAGYRVLRLLWDDLHAEQAVESARRVQAMLV